MYLMNKNDDMTREYFELWSFCILLDVILAGRVEVEWEIGSHFRSLFSTSDRAAEVSQSKSNELSWILYFN